MLTADATQVQMKNAMNAGVNAFMSKPIKMNVLHRKLFAIFAHPLVYIREGRTLRPLLAVQSSCTPAAPRQSAAAAPAKAPAKAPEPKDGNDDTGPVDLDQQPLTRRDLGFR